MPHQDIQLASDNSPGALGPQQRRNILRFEKMYGHGFLSPGGIEAVRFYCSLLNMREGMRIINVGSGLGGDAFFLAERYRANVVGLEFAHDLVELSTERLRHLKMGKVVFLPASIRKVQFQRERFDLAWSRDYIMYVEDKDLLFQNIYRSLKRDGEFFLTDMYTNIGPLSSSVQSYLSRFQYYVRDLGSYMKSLEGSGFARVRYEDITDAYMHAYREEQNAFAANRSSFLHEFDENDYNYLMNRWDEKISMCAMGDLKWGLFIAYK